MGRTVQQREDLSRKMEALLATAEAVRDQPGLGAFLDNAQPTDVFGIRAKELLELRDALKLPPI